VGSWELKPKNILRGVPLIRQILSHPKAASPRGTAWKPSF
jgi:hypothetical protein